jgi:hypothetical protein
MPEHPRDAKVNDMVDQLDQVSADIDAPKHKIAQDPHLDLGSELFADDEPGRTRR